MVMVNRARRIANIIGSHLPLAAFLLLFCQGSVADAQPAWPVVSQEAKAGARWWWLGSAVDKENLQWNMQEYAKAGIGSLEITPIYGVQGNQKNELSFLSAPWMEALKYSEEEGRKNGIAIDMSTGTGWPFGGPASVSGRN